LTLFESNQKVLVIGSHPDDIEYACSGTLIKIKENYNCEIKCLVLSFGSEGDESSGMQRVEETKEALLSKDVADEIIVLERHYPTSPNINKESNFLRKIILEFKPDLILTHSPFDTHQEHITTNQITITAARRMKSSILEYPMLSSTPEFKPTIFSDITNYFPRKLQLLERHQSQADKSYMNHDFLELFNKSAYALLHSCDYVEKFSIHRLIFK
tara:strand:+ start:172 stop:813 length:642 start_codon:yes stop_codon:yes gene_type:complete